MTFAEFRAWVALAGGLLLLGLFAAMLMSWLRERARRHGAGWTGHLGGGAARPPRASGLRSYADVAHEHRDHGDEDPPLYGRPATGTDEDEALPAARAASRLRLSALAGLDLVRAQLGVTPASDTTRRQKLRAEEARLLAIVVQFARGGPGDGRRLSREESADLVQTVLGGEQA